MRRIGRGQHKKSERFVYENENVNVILSGSETLYFSFSFNFIFNFRFEFYFHAIIYLFFSGKQLPIVFFLDCAPLSRSHVTTASLRHTRT